MRRIQIHFEQDTSLDYIDVLIRATEKDAAVTRLMDELTASPPGTLTLFDGYGNLKTFHEDEMISASAEGRLVNVATVDGDWYTRRSLQALEEVLDKRRFIRISRFEIINLERVQRYDFTINGTLKIVMENGMQTWASRRYIPAIRRYLKEKG